jgi:hypothetical protein
VDQERREEPTVPPASQGAGGDRGGRARPSEVAADAERAMEDAEDVDVAGGCSPLVFLRHPVAEV